MRHQLENGLICMRQKCKISTAWELDWENESLGDWYCAELFDVYGMFNFSIQRTNAKNAHNVGVVHLHKTFETKNG